MEDDDEEMTQQMYSMVTNAIEKSSWTAQAQTEKLEERLEQVETQLQEQDVHKSLRLMEQLLDMLEFYENFEVDDMSGDPLTMQQVLQGHYNHHNTLREICFDMTDELKKNVSLSHI